MEINKVQWRIIAKGEKLPCDSFLMKQDGTIPLVISSAGVVIGQDAYYLSVEELRTLPKEESGDERIRKGIIRNLEYLMDRAEGFVKDELKERIAWLEKQGEQKPADNQFTPEQAGVLDKHIDKFLEQKPQRIVSAEAKEAMYNKPAWSEEDEKQARQIERIVSNDGCTKKLQEQIHNWFESLKVRVQPQSQWKPSEEMLEALYKAIPENVMAISEDEMLLDKLYQGLKYGRVLSKN